MKLATADRPVVAADRGSDGPHQKLADAVKAYVCGHPMERLTLSDIAEHFALSPNCLSHYMTTVRIGKAIELMQQHRMKVKEVAEMLGYDNTESLSKVFRKVTGRLPTEWSRER